MTEPIESATLARLYLSQGHETKARAMLRRLVEARPDDGDALALDARLGPAPGQMTARVAGADLVVGWQGVRSDATTHVIAVTMRHGPHGVRTGVTSVPCATAFGRVRFARPTGRGALSACIGKVVPGSGFVVLAIATPVHWG